MKRNRGFPRVPGSASDMTRKMFNSPVILALGLDALLAAVGLWSQWFGARYAHAHGLGAWRFGLIEFLIIEFVLFGGTGVVAFSMTNSRRSQLVLGWGSAVLWLACAYWGFFFWLNYYGS